MLDMPLLIRRARREDLAHIVRMLVDDSLGAQQERLEDPLPTSYLEVFTAISPFSLTLPIVEVGEP
jgi:hypothetical protein